MTTGEWQWPIAAVSAFWICGLALYGFVVGVGGRSAFRVKVLEDDPLHPD